MTRNMECWRMIIPNQKYGNDNILLSSYLPIMVTLNNSNILLSSYYALYGHP